MIPLTLFGLDWSVLVSVASVYWTRSPFPLRQSCQDFYAFIQSYHVWKDQAENHIRNTPALRLSTPELTTLSLKDLKAIAIRRAKLRARWERSDDDSSFIRGGLVAGTDMLQQTGSSQWILPGGNHLLVYTMGNLALHQILWSDDAPRLSQPTTTYDLNPGVGNPGRNALLLTTSPHPIFAGVEDLTGG